MNKYEAVIVATEFLNRNKMFNIVESNGFLFMHNGLPFWYIVCKMDQTEDGFKPVHNTADAIVNCKTREVFDPFSFPDRKALLTIMERMVAENGW